jgi:hypothetical protein
MGPEVDHARRRALFVAEPGFSGTALCRAVAAMFDADPKTASYDFVFDTRRTDTGITPADIQIVAETYGRHPRDGGVKYSFFVSTDVNYPYLTAVMDALFDDRTNKVFVSLENAEAELERLRA